MNEVFKDGWDVGEQEKGETVCGWGSEIVHTTNIRSTLPGIIKEYNVSSINDAGCGDLCWISQVDMSDVDYMGYDIVSRRSWNKKLTCQELDISKHTMRQADMIICRDVFIHLPNGVVLEALKHFRECSSLLLTTTFMPAENNGRIKEPSLKYSKLDLSLAPFNLGVPSLCLEEDCHGKFSCLWRI